MSAFLVIVYVGIAIWKKKELPESISATVYELPKAGQWVWSAWLAAIAVCLFVPLVERCEWVGWLMEVSLIGAALTPLFKKDTLRWHYVFAIITGILSQICVVMLDAMWLGVWMVFVFLFLSSYVQPDGWLGKAMKGKGVFLAQMVCFVGLTGSLLCRAAATHVINVTGNTGCDIVI